MAAIRRLTLRSKASLRWVSSLSSIALWSAEISEDISNGYSKFKGRLNWPPLEVNTAPRTSSSLDLTRHTTLPKGQEFLGIFRWLIITTSPTLIAEVLSLPCFARSLNSVKYSPENRFQKCSVKVITWLYRLNKWRHILPGHQWW